MKKKIVFNKMDINVCSKNFKNYIYINSYNEVDLITVE